MGNILATITDAKIYQTNGSLAKVISGSDYYAFGAAMPSRSYQDAAYTKYRYGFNGKENDRDIGEEISDFDARLLDKKTGRWMAVDPKAGKYPNMSPYSAMANSPISFLDPNGEDGIIYIVIMKDKNGKAEVPKPTAEQIIYHINKQYEKLGLSTRAVLYDETNGGGAINSKYIDATDNIALIGRDRNNITQYMEKNVNKGAATAKGYLVTIERWAENNDGVNPERSVNPNTGLGNVGIVVDYDNILTGFQDHFLNKGTFGKKSFKQIIAPMKEATALIEYAATLVVHGSGHGAGLDHSDEKTMQENHVGPLITTIGSKSESLINAIVGMSPDKEIPKMEKRYGTGTPSVNYYNTKRVYEKHGEKAGKSYKKSATN